MSSFGCLALSVFVHALNVVAFFLVGCMLYPEMPTTLAQHFSMVPLTLFTMAVPLPFGAWASPSWSAASSSSWSAIPTASWP